MEETVTISLNRYSDLLRSEYKLDLTRWLLFGGDNSLSYDKKEIMFSPDCKQVKLAFPFEYSNALNALQKESRNNV